MWALIQVLLAIGCVTSAPAKASFKPQQLFVLMGDRADLRFAGRPTPCIAAMENGDIAFPIRAGEIAVFDGRGSVRSTVSEPSMDFPSRLAFSRSGALIALSSSARLIVIFDGNRVTKEPFSAARWYSLVAPRVLDVAQRHGIDGLSVGQAAIGPDGCAYVRQVGIERVCDGTREGVAGTAPGEIVGVVDRDTYILADTTDCFIWKGRDNRAESLPSLDLVPRPVLNESNAPEENKANTWSGWYWQPARRQLYRVIHTPSAFYFLRYDLRR